MSEQAGQVAEVQLPHVPDLPRVPLGCIQRFGPSDEMTAWVAERLGRGWTIAAVCRFVGMSLTTFNKWCRRGEDAMELARTNVTGVPGGEQHYVRFALEVGKARAQVEGALINKLMGSKDDRAAMFMLERMFPRDFGQAARVELTGEGGGPIEVMPAREFIRQRIEQTSERLRNGLRVVDVPSPDTPELPPAAEG